MKYWLMMLLTIPCIATANSRTYLELDSKTTTLKGYSMLDLYPLGAHSLVPQPTTETQLDLTARLNVGILPNMDVFMHATDSHKKIITETTSNGTNGVLGTNVDIRGVSYGGGVRIYFN